MRCGPAASWTTTPLPRACSSTPGNWLGDEHAKDDANYGWGAGFALEAEMYPDTPHQPLFPQGIVGPGHPYSNVIEYHFMRH